MPDLAEVSAELYAVPPEDFVPARTARVKQLRSDGDRALAAAVSRLPKPTTAAWLLNLLVRERPEQVRELISLGDALREAQQKLSGSKLRQLSQQRHEVIAAFTSMALAPADGAGRAVTNELTSQVQDTLGAAIADPEAGAALLSGRLTKGLSYVGLGELSPAGATPDQLAPKRTAGTDPRARAQRAREKRLDAARAEIGRLEQEAEAAAQRVNQLQQEVDAAQAARTALRARVDELRAALADAEGALQEAEHDVRAAAARAAAAQEAADDLVAAVDSARSKLEEEEADGSAQAR